uniref:Venom polypeptide n=1 Tax=Dolopus genitalis TaxID=2488630 RepID=A0A3G5BIM9_DOLGE|nr:venom polypeptide [Dolopus genitalis]
MRIAFFLLLALCSYSAKAQTENDLDVAYLEDIQMQVRGPILDAALDIVKKINEEVRKAIEAIIAKTEEIIKDVREKIENAAKTAMDKIRALVKKIEERLAKIAKKGDVAKSCVDKGMPKIKEAIQNAETDNKQCIWSTLEQAKNIVEEIKKHIEDIQDKCDANKDLVAECMETNGSVWGATKCITKQVWTFNKNIFGMLGDVKNLLFEAVKSSFQVVANGISCLTDVGRTAEKQIIGAVKGIEQCIASNKLEDFNNRIMSY